MKKTTIGIIIGVGVLIVCVCVLLVLFNPFGKEDLQAGNTIETENDEKIDDILFVDTQDALDTETENLENEHIESEITDTEIPEIETEVVENPENEPTPVPEPKPVVVQYPYYIKVNRLMNCITVYSMDSNGNYTMPVKAMVCSVGRQGAATPTGKYQTKAKYVWREMYGGVYGQYATRIVGHVLFHSVPYSVAKNDALLTEAYNKLGQPASSGCIRLTVQDAKWIYDNCGIGTTVEIYDGPDVGPLGKPSSLKIDVNSPYKGWDPTDPLANNPWKTVKPVISGVKDITFERGQKVDYTSYVTTKDSWGNVLDTKTSGTVDTKNCGTYTITYSAVDPLGNTASATAKITITDTTAPVISQTQEIVITDSSIDIEKMIWDAISVTDNGDVLDKSSATLDLSALTSAMEQKEYGTILCEATATDKYGNKSSVYTIKVVYEKEDMEAPVITVLMEPTVNVDLAQVTDEAERQMLVLNTAINSVQKFNHYMVTDDVSTAEEITCTITGNYNGATVAGEHEVVLTITATDKTGKISSKEFVVMIIVSDRPQTE